MEARKFNSIMPLSNHKWASEILGMEINYNSGPDLIDEEKFLELKFALINPKKHKEIKNRNYPKSWTVMDHQMDYENKTGLEGYWGLGFYELDRPVKTIRKNTYNLETFIISRELYIVKFDWMNQFPKSHTSGKTEISEWNNWLRYPLFNKIPAVSKTYKVNGGNIHLTKGVRKKNFNLETINTILDGVPF